jgi:hypothetical protein
MNAITLANAIERHGFYRHNAEPNLSIAVAIARNFPPEQGGPLNLGIASETISVARPLAKNREISG